jgi:hypothetical protein
MLAQRPSQNASYEEFIDGTSANLALQWRALINDILTTPLGFLYGFDFRRRLSLLDPFYEPFEGGSVGGQDRSQLVGVVIVERVYVGPSLYRVVAMQMGLSGPLNELGVFV